MPDSPQYDARYLPISVETRLPFDFSNEPPAEEWNFDPGSNSDAYASSSGSPSVAEGSFQYPISPSPAHAPAASTSASTSTSSSASSFASTSALPIAAPSPSIALPPNYIPPSDTPSTRSRSPNHVPRPRNAFMIFRSSFLATQQLSTSIERDHRHISRIIAHCWNSLPAPEKASWRAAADFEKAVHAEKHPGYRFAPVCRAVKPIKRKVKRNGVGEMERCKQVAALILSGKKGGELEEAVKGIAITDDDDADVPVPTPVPVSTPKGKGKARAKSASPPKRSTPAPPDNTTIIHGWAPAVGSYEECRVPIFRSPLLPPTELRRGISSPSPTPRYTPYAHKSVTRPSYEDYTSQSPSQYEQRPSSSSRHMNSAEQAPSPHHELTPLRFGHYEAPNSQSPHYSTSPTHLPSPQYESNVPLQSPQYLHSPVYDSPHNTPPYGVEYSQVQSSQPYSPSPTRRPRQYGIVEYADRTSTPPTPGAPLPNSTPNSSHNYEPYPTPTRRGYASPYQHAPIAFPLPATGEFNEPNPNYGGDGRLTLDINVNVNPASENSVSSAGAYHGGTNNSASNSASPMSSGLGGPSHNPFFAEPYTPSSASSNSKGPFEPVPTRESVYSFPWEDRGST